MHGFPHKPALAILFFIGLGALTEAAPALQNYKFLNWDTIPSILDFRAREAAYSLDEELARMKPGLALERGQPQPLDGSDHLGSFYEALLATEQEAGDHIVSVVHYGDSPTAADLITADVRALLQQKFGDAGHGFALIAKPWPWYRHHGIEISSSGWKINPAHQTHLRDGMFGLGGVTFQGRPGAYSEIRIRDSGHFSIEIASQQTPSGGVVRLSANGAIFGEIDTAGTASIARFAEFPLPAGVSEVSVEAVSGEPRLFGFQLRKQGSGVTYHSLGLNGAHTSVLANMFNERHWAEQLQHYRPHLVVINYGTNESVYAKYIDTAYEKELRRVIRRVRTALPQASILIMSPMDRGHRDSTGSIATVPGLERLVVLQQRIAAETGCAFFNTFRAMGGSGTMSRWYEAQPRLVSADFIHPMPNGAKLVGTLLYRSLIQGYQRYKARSLSSETAALQ